MRNRPCLVGVRGRNRSGFTSPELLIVIVLISMVFAILVPVTTSIRRSARLTSCASNLRQLGQAIHAYRAEGKDFPYARAQPLPWASPSTTSAPPLYDALARQLDPGSGVYRCPADSGQVFDRCAGAGSGRGTSYVYAHAALQTARRPLPTNWKGVMMYDCNSLPDGTVFRPQFHRRGGTNTLFTDGSVQFEEGNVAEQ